MLVSCLCGLQLVNPSEMSIDCYFILILGLLPRISEKEEAQKLPSMFQVRYHKHIIYSWGISPLIMTEEWVLLLTLADCIFENLKYVHWVPNSFIRVFPISLETPLSPVDHNRTAYRRVFQWIKKLSLSLPRGYPLSSKILHLHLLHFYHVKINLHFMIKVKMIYMARKHKRNQETYARLGFLPKPKELTNTTIEQNI